MDLSVDLAKVNAEGVALALKEPVNWLMVPAGGRTGRVPAAAIWMGV